MLNELKEAWNFTGIDVVKMVNDIYELNNYYENPCTKWGIAKFLIEFAKNNKANIELMMKSPDYNGNLQICRKIPFNRSVNATELEHYFDNFADKLEARRKVINDKNNDGKTFWECVGEAAQSMPDVIDVKNILEYSDKSVIDMENYTIAGENVYFKPSIEKYNVFLDAIQCFKYYSEPTVDEEFWNKISKKIPELKGGVGMKTSRLLGRICALYGFSERDPEYARTFPVYGDMINPLEREVFYVISLNPIDFLTMSRGNTWASCQTLDKNNKDNLENSYHGAYASGTISYALDNVTFVTYILRNPSSNPEMERKMYRNLMSYDTKSGYLIQGRVYPQSNDGAQDLYRDLRALFQEEIARVENIDNLWTKKGGSYELKHDGIFSSTGTHYRDYEMESDSYRGCNVSRLKAKPELETEMIIGHQPINLYTGAFHCTEDEIGYHSSSQEREIGTDFNFLMNGGES